VLRQRHVGDVVWLPQAGERGGVGERWRSARSERGKLERRGGEHREAEDEDNDGKEGGTCLKKKKKKIVRTFDRRLSSRFLLE